MSCEPKVDNKWEIEEAARTLIRAEEIRNDKKLFPLAQKELVRQQKAAKNALARSNTVEKVDKKLKDVFGD